MKIVFLTASPNSAASFYYWNAMKTMPEITFFKNGMDMNAFDACLVMTYDHQYVSIIKKNFPNLKVGLVDPRNYKVTESALESDFIVCDSIEMEDYWRKVAKPIFRYVEYPNITTVKKDHVKKEKITIGYHGNQIHLDCMSEKVTPALNNLAKKYNIELLVMHNGSAPSGNEKWYPDNINVRHVKWSMENYLKELSKIDIGIAPNNMIHNDEQMKQNETASAYNYSPDDYSLRFKMPSNPGRFLIYGKLGVPCVADFYPSALQLLDGENGFVAHNIQGWQWCLEQLIKSSSLRQKMGDNLQKLVEDKFDFHYQNDKFLKFLRNLGEKNE